MNTKIDWARKLTSRKFWMAVTGFVSSLLIFLGYSESVAVQVTALIMSGAAVIAYCIGEGLADSGNGVMTIEDPEAEAND